MPRVWSSDEARIRNITLSNINGKRILDENPELKKATYKKQAESAKKRDRYNNDAEYRLKTIENAKASYQRKKALNAEIALLNLTNLNIG